MDSLLTEFGPGDLLLVQNETSNAAYAIRQAKNKGMRVALNASPVDGRLRTYPLEAVDYFLVNEIEGACLAGMDPSEDPEKILEQMRRLYPNAVTVLTLGVTAVLMAALTLFIDRTKLGKAMRAVSEDKDAATLMGISVDRTITLTFAIGSALAAFASMFYGMTYVYIKPTTGAMPGIKAFTAAVFGGIGSIPGAMLGGILLGLIEQASKTYISTLWADAIVFAVLVAVLVVKPTGLLGKPIQEKV